MRAAKVFISECSSRQALHFDPEAYSAYDEGQNGELNKEECRKWRLFIYSSRLTILHFKGNFAPAFRKASLAIGAATPSISKSMRPG